MVDEKILSKTKGGQQKAERLKAVCAKELELEKQVDACMSEYSTTIDRLTDVKQRRQANLAELSKLDGAIANGKQYTGDLQTLIEDLTGELDELGRNVATMKDARGMERLVGRFNKKWARQMTVKRIRDQNVESTGRLNHLLDRRNDLTVVGDVRDERHGSATSPERSHRLTQA